jgi:predicted transcriptional regulator YheO
MAEKKKPIKKKRFILMVEAIAPVTLKMETWAEDENQAIEQLSKKGLCKIIDRPDIVLQKMKISKVTIKDAISSLVKLVKRF